MREIYEQEIRDYLIARIEKQHSDGRLPQVIDTQLPTSRIADWWIFEGRRYHGLDASLALEWPRVARQMQSLLRTHNPRWRSVQAPEGDVDWVATALTTATSLAPEYICRASRVGLSGDEHAALLGWCSWISRRWQNYCQRVDVPLGAMARLPWDPHTGDISELQLKRWALTARRSRWPLLRNVVAESIRVLFEPTWLDRVPLPAEPSRLFELICLVRVLRTLAPNPSIIKWIDDEAASNQVAVDGVRCWFQRSFKREELFCTPEYDEALRAATERHRLRVHRDIDVLVQFAEPRVGFNGIILEAKSGLQSYNDAVAQLKHYRAAIRRDRGGRWLVWGVRETEEADAVTREAIDAVAIELRGTDDVWFFSPAAAIPAVLRGLGLAQ